MQRPEVDHRADQRSRLSTPCGTWLAWASMAVPACCRIWVRVSSAVSLAKSVSLMRLRDADRFSDEVWVGHHRGEAVLDRTEVGAGAVDRTQGLVDDFHRLLGTLHGADVQVAGVLGGRGGGGRGEGRRGGAGPGTRGCGDGLERTIGVDAVLDRGQGDARGAVHFGVDAGFADLGVDRGDQRFARGLAGGSGVGALLDRDVGNGNAVDLQAAGAEVRVGARVGQGQRVGVELGARALALASMVLSMAMAWPALAPTWNSWLENEPSSSLVPLKSDCLATRSISLTSWVTSACSALRSLAELVALEACTDSSRTRCRLLPISVSEPSATWASEMPSLALRMATSVPRICVPKRSEIASRRRRPWRC